MPTKKTTGESGSAPKIPQKFFDDAWVTVLAPQESFWRTHAKPSSQEKFITEQAKNGIALAEKLLAMLGQGAWPSLDDCIPTGTILDVVDKFFYEATDLPRELPFYNVIHYVSSLLLQQGVHIQKSKIQIIFPDVWTIVMAGSGGGKTMTLDAISNAMGGKVKMFPDANSYPKFFENLQAHNRSFYLKDEFAKFINAVNRDSKMEGMRGCLLNVYSNADLSYSTKASTEHVKRPALSILGLTQIANITETITASMINDGFAQRFSYVFAEKDNRPRKLNYIFDGLGELVAPLWTRLTATPFHPVYYLDDVLNDTFEAGGNLIIDRADADGVGEDFSRRIVFRSFKYALVYHVLAGKTDKYLHAEDMAHGLRLCARELRDTSRLIDMFGLLKPAEPKSAPGATVSAALSSAPSKKNSAKKSSLTYAKCVEKAKKKVLDFAAKGKLTETRNLGSFIKGVEVSVLAKILAELAQDPALKPHIILRKD